jgi:preprotein translocase subunit SecF
MIDFLKYRVVYAVFSLAIFATFIGAYVYKRQTRGEAFVYSVDFTGGTQVLLGFSEPVHSEKVTDILKNSGWSGVEARTFSEKEVLVRVPLKQADQVDVIPAEQVKFDLEKEMPGIKVEIKQTDSVGAGVGASLRWKSLQAIIAGLLVMLLYIAWRFWSMAFAVGAVVSLFHDAIVILTFFLLFDYEISMNVIGAILAVLGYSINDTIVIFSRIRENIARMPHESIESIVNLSTNQTLRRTLLTSFATTLVVIALVLFGGEALRTLSISLLIGFVFGTYSSIYIASPVMLLLYKKNN